MLTNNEIKDIIKVIRSLENSGVLLKGTTKKITTQEEGFLNFLKPLIIASLPLINQRITVLAKSVLVPLGLTATASATYATIQKKIYGSGTTTLLF